MDSKQKMGNAIYNFSVILWDYLLGNMCFLLMNIHVPLFFILFKVTNAFVLIICMYLLTLNILPSYVALRGLYEDENREGRVIRCYIEKYRKDFINTFVSGALASMFIMLMFVNFLYFSKIQLLSIFFAIVMLVAIIWFLNYSTILTRFNFRPSQMIPLNIIYFIKLSRGSLFSFGFLLGFCWIMLTGGYFIIGFMFAGTAKIHNLTSKNIIEEIFQFHTLEGQEKNPYVK